MSALPTRREHETHELQCGKMGTFTLRLGYFPGTTQIMEVFFDQRGKVGTELNEFLERAGILISRRLQGKDV